MSNEAYITDMTEQHLEQATDLLVRSFLTLNSIWKKYNYTYETIYPILRSKVVPCVTSEWSYVRIISFRFSSRMEKLLAAQLILSFLITFRAHLCQQSLNSSPS